MHVVHIGTIDYGLLRMSRVDKLFIFFADILPISLRRKEVWIGSTTSSKQLVALFQGSNYGVVDVDWFHIITL